MRKSRLDNDATHAKTMRFLMRILPASSFCVRDCFAKATYVKNLTTPKADVAAPIKMTVKPMEVA